jgi:hypothetical protein
MYVYLKFFFIYLFIHVFPHTDKNLITVNDDCANSRCLFWESHETLQNTEWWNANVTVKCDSYSYH